MNMVSLDYANQNRNTIQQKGKADV